MTTTLGTSYVIGVNDDYIDDPRFSDFDAALVYCREILQESESDQWLRKDTPPVIWKLDVEERHGDNDVLIDVTVVYLNALGVNES